MKISDYIHFMLRIEELTDIPNEYMTDTMFIELDLLMSLVSLYEQKHFVELNS